MKKVCAWKTRAKNALKMVLTFLIDNIDNIFSLIKLTDYAIVVNLIFSSLRMFFFRISS